MLTRRAMDFNSYVKRRRDVSWYACAEQKIHLRLEHAKSYPFEKQNKKPGGFTLMEAAEWFTLELCMHTQQASQCKWRGLLEMKEGLTSPLVRDHCLPFCYSRLWSCGKQMTSEPQHCVQLLKKRKGEGEAVLWEGQRPCCPVFQRHPHHAIPPCSMEMLLMSPAPAAAQSATNCNLSRESKTPFPRQHKGVSHLAARLVTLA